MAVIPMLQAEPLLEQEPLIAGKPRGSLDGDLTIPARQRRHLKRLLINAPAGDAVSGLGLFGLLWLGWAGAALLCILSVG